MNRSGKYGGFRFRENCVGFYGDSVLVAGNISDKAARRNCAKLNNNTLIDGNSVNIGR